MRNLISCAAAVLACVLAATASAADSPAASKPAAAAKGVDAAQSDKPQPTPQKPAQSSCLNRCDTNDAKCGSDVRRAKTQCARTASTAGQDPLTQRAPNDYTYFCGFFGDPGAGCGSGYYSASCTARFRHRYGLCLDTMYNDVAAMRFDCMKAEREAQRLCRDELQDCKAQCEDE